MQNFEADTPELTLVIKENKIHLNVFFILDINKFYFDVLFNTPFKNKKKKKKNGGKDNNVHCSK